GATPVLARVSGYAAAILPSRENCRIPASPLPAAVTRRRWQPWNLGNPRRCAAGTAVCVAEGRPDADLKTPERRMCRAGRGGIRASTMETVVADAFELWKAMEVW